MLKAQRQAELDAKRALSSLSSLDKASKEAAKAREMAEADRTLAQAERAQALEAQAAAERARQQVGAPRHPLASRWLSLSVLPLSRLPPPSLAFSAGL